MGGGASFFGGLLGGLSGPLLQKEEEDRKRKYADAQGRRKLAEFIAQNPQQFGGDVVKAATKALLLPSGPQQGRGGKAKGKQGGDPLMQLTQMIDSLPTWEVPEGKPIPMRDSVIPGQELPGIPGRPGFLRPGVAESPMDILRERESFQAGQETRKETAQQTLESQKEAGRLAEEQAKEAAAAQRDEAKARMQRDLEAMKETSAEKRETARDRSAERRQAERDAAAERRQQERDEALAKGIGLRTVVQRQKVEKPLRDAEQLLDSMKDYAKRGDAGDAQADRALLSAHIAMTLRRAGVRPTQNLIHDAETARSLGDKFAVLGTKWTTGQSLGKDQRQQMLNLAVDNLAVIRNSVEKQLREFDAAAGPPERGSSETSTVPSAPEAPVKTADDLKKKFGIQ